MAASSESAATPADGASGGLRRDLRRLILLVLVSGIAGLALNLVRNPPLPWSYRTKAERLRDDLRQLTGEPEDHRSTGAFARISLADLQEALAAGRTKLIDARTPLFFRAGHLPGAENLPRDGFQAAYARHRAGLETDAGQPLVVYCQGGSCEDSDMVASALRALGFSNISVFPGGWKEWQAAGLPVETGL